MQLFWREGYESTSLQDLLTAMGLSKSSFYQAFMSKHALFQQCIHRYRAQLIGAMKAQLGEAESGRGFIEELFHGVAREASGREARRGCLLMNTAGESAQTDPVIADLVTDGIEDFTDVLADAVEKAQRQVNIPVARDARTLAVYLVSSISGLRNMAKAGVWNSKDGSDSD